MFFFFVKETATTELYTYCHTLSLPDAIPISGNKRGLIDTGTGGALAPTTGKLLDHLRAAGYEPAQIDEILITHLHPDRVGGVTHDGKAVFPNAVLDRKSTRLNSSH